MSESFPRSFWPFNAAKGVDGSGRACHDKSWVCGLSGEDDFGVDSELSCRVLVAHQMSASFCFCSAVGVGEREACPYRPQRFAAERSKRRVG